LYLRYTYFVLSRDNAEKGVCILRRKLKFSRSFSLCVPIVLALAIFAGGAVALAGCAPDESTAGDAQPRKCFIISKTSDNFSREAQRSAFGAVKIPVSGDGFLAFSETPGPRRLPWEKNAASAAAAQEFFAAANVPFGVSPTPEAASSLIRQLSVQIAVRK
jgi:hypothetical protein